MINFIGVLKKNISAGIWTVLLCFIVFSHPLFAQGILNEVKIVTYSDNSIMLFPDLPVSDFNLIKESDNVYSIDCYNCVLGSNTPKILASPHPAVKFLRVSQVSGNPPVMRVTMFFLENFALQVRTVSDRLIADFRKTPVVASKQIVVPQQKNTINDLYTRTTSAQPISVLDSKLSLSFVDTELMEILQAIAKKLDLRIFADSGVKGKFTVHAYDVTLKEALKSILLQKGFQYTLKGRNLTVVSLASDDSSSSKKAKELVFKDLSLKDALQTLARMMNINLVVHQDVKDRSVNFYVENLSLDDLLELLIQSNGLVKTAFNENTFIISEKDTKYDYAPKEFRTFKLVNASPNEIINTISSNKALSERLNVDSFSVNERINTLSVYDTAENIKLLEKIVKSSDEKLKQAIIEVKLIEINRTALKQLGIRLDDYLIKVADIGRIPSSYALPATLDFLEKESQAKILASPKIRAVHGKKANINIGEVIPVPYYKYEIASGSPPYWGGYGYVPQLYKEYKDVQVGISLEVTPEISRDNEISMELNTTINSVLDINTDGQIHKAERTTSTYVRVKNGETVVMGGLINNKGSETKESPALVNKLPVVRSIFGNKRKETNRTEMIMLVTPTLVNTDFEDEMHIGGK